MMEHSVIFPDHRKVCALGQGTWKMGKSALREADEIDALRAGIELGMSVVDTAEMYGNEEMVGAAIRGLRDRVFLVTKVLPGNASRTGTKAACERSLNRLKTDYVDLFLLHWGGPHPIEDTVASMIELQQEGKIKAWGVSNMDVPEMERFYAVPGGVSCAANQILYNLAHRGVEYDLLPWCRERHLPVMAYSPADEGRLSRNPVLMEIAQKHEATPDFALPWNDCDPQSRFRHACAGKLPEFVHQADCGRCGFAGWGFSAPGQKGASGFLVNRDAVRQLGRSGTRGFSCRIRIVSSLSSVRDERAPAGNFNTRTPCG